MDKMNDLKQRIDDVCKAHFKKGVEELLSHEDYSTLRDFLMYPKNQADFAIEVVTHVNHCMQQDGKGGLIKNKKGDIVMSVYEFGRYRPYSWRFLFLALILSSISIDNVLQNVLIESVGYKIVNLFILIGATVIILFIQSKTISFFYTLLVCAILVYPSSNAILYNTKGVMIEPKSVLSTNKIVFKEVIAFKIIYNMGEDINQEFDVYLYPKTLKSYEKVKIIDGEKYLINSSLNDFIYGLLSPYGNIAYEIKKSQS